MIERRYGVTVRQWLDENYPGAKPFGEDVRREMTEAFVKDYLRIRPKSADEFNARRLPGTPCWHTVARRHHMRRWRELLEKLDLPAYSHTEAPEKPSAFQVKIHTHYDFTD